MKVSWSWALNMVINDDYHWLNGHEHGQTPGDSEGQGSLTTVHGVAKNQTWLSDWITEFFAVGSSPGHCGIFKSILGIYTPVTSPSQAVTATKNIFRYHQTFPGGQNHSIVHLTKPALGGGTLRDQLRRVHSYRERWKSTLNLHWKDWHWSWSSNSVVTWWEEPTHWKRTQCWERLKAGGEGGSREEMFRSHHWLSGHESEETGN